MSLDGNNGHECVLRFCVFLNDFSVLFMFFIVLCDIFILLLLLLCIRRGVWQVTSDVGRVQGIKSGIPYKGFSGPFAACLGQEERSSSDERW